MANKIGFLNGIFLIILNFLAAIPIGIFFGTGISAYSNIPLYFFQSGNVTIYAWGIVQDTTASWWLNLGILGISGLIVEGVLVVCTILSLVGCWVIGNKGKNIMIATLIMEIIGFVFLIVDSLWIGSLGLIIPFTELIQSIGIGIYFMLVIVILQIIAVKVHDINIE